MSNVHHISVIKRILSRQFLCPFMKIIHDIVAYVCGLILNRNMVEDKMVIPIVSPVLALKN